MQIVNPEVDRSLAMGIPLKLDLGAGPAPRNGFFSLDHLALPGIDIVANLNHPLDLLPDNCCEHLVTFHTLEHVQELLPLMREVHRIVRPNGIFDVLVPHYSNHEFYSDPTHVRFFGIYSMHYFADPEDQPGDRPVPSFYTDARFLIESVSVGFADGGFIDGLIGPLLNRTMNKSFRRLAFWERRLAFAFRGVDIKWRLRAKKVEDRKTSVS
jgi:SAM-dependent methyltransferase